MINNLNVIEELNVEYKKLLDSREYQAGKKFLKAKYYIKHFQLIKLFKKIFNSKKMKEYVFKKDNFNNNVIFKDNRLNTINQYSTNDKIVIYTVNIGKYDTLVQPLFDNPNVDFVLISDIKPKELGKWKWLDANKYVGNLSLSNVKKARYLKTHPHIMFGDYKYSIFIDGNIRCVTDISKFVKSINKNTGIAIHPHYYRDCIYKEYKSCVVAKKGNSKVMKMQVDKYKAEGMPYNFGLFETGVVVREHNNSNCIKLMEMWWNEIDKYSERDQLSLTYVLWKNNYVANDIGVIYASIKDNPSLQLLYHNEKY